MIQWGGTAAIEATVGTWDGFITTRNFTKNNSTTQKNPCTNEASLFQWITIDEEGPILATASVCRSVVTKEIAGFVISIDKDELWTTSGVADRFDVENAMAHEFGHVAGLGHVNAPRDGCLTMYKFAPLNETRKRTLGLGDKLGMTALYGFFNEDPGTCP